MHKASIKKIKYQNAKIKIKDVIAALLRFRNFYFLFLISRILPQLVRQNNN